jgi:hypothetical protein
MSDDLDFTSLLFPRPSLAEGAGRLLDFGGTLTEFNRMPSAAAADAVAIASDWFAVGSDLRRVVSSNDPNGPRKPSK